MAKQNYYKAETIDGEIVEFAASASDFYTRDSVFCMFLEFDGTIGQRVEDIRFTDLRVLNG